MADGSIIFDTALDQSGLKTGLSGMAGTIAKGTAAALAAAGAAASAIVKEAVSAYADYEQLVGGMDTLFKESSGAMQAYAETAFRTAGLSSNAYMETVTSFSASLISSLGGDTEKAVGYADMAITDMADNANKMGTAMYSIQDAYQGFAKQNYTMLDNLKLGYGGTKQEMERLLEDAQALTGIEYDISSYADVVAAIHAIQTEMGITGTTAAEASETITGSASAMKAAWGNMLVGIADDSADFDTLVSNLANTTATFLTNLIPRINIAINGVAKLIETTLPVIVNRIPEIIIGVLPGLVSAATELLTGFTETIIAALPELLSIGTLAVTTLVDGIADALPTLIPAATEAVITIVGGLLDSLPKLIQSGLELITALVEGILNAIPVLVAALPQIIDTLVNGLLSSIPTIIQTGVELLTALVDNLPTIISTIVAALPKIISSIINAVTGNIGLIAHAGVQLLTSLVKNLPAIISTVIKSIPQIISGIISAITGSIPQMAQAGYSLLSGLASGIGNAIGSVVARAREAAQRVVSSVKSFFGIHSPSKVFTEIGDNLMLGLAGGITDEARAAIDATQDAADKITGVDFSVEKPDLSLDPGGVDYSALVAQAKSTVQMAVSTTGITVGESQAFSAYRAGSDDGKNEPHEKADSPQVVKGDVFLDKKKIGRIMAPIIDQEIQWAATN